MGKCYGVLEKMYQLRCEKGVVFTKELELLLKTLEHFFHFHMNQITKPAFLT